MKSKRLLAAGLALAVFLLCGGCSAGTNSVSGGTSSHHAESHYEESHHEESHHEEAHH